MKKYWIKFSIRLLVSFVVTAPNGMIGAEKLTESDARILLQKLQMATENSAVSGIYNVQEQLRDGEKNTGWQIYVWPDNRAVYKFIPAADDSAAPLIIRDGDDLFFKSSDGDSRRGLKRRFHHWYHNQRLFIDPELLAQNYTFETEVGPEYLGRATQSLIISSAYEGRMAVAMLFDREIKFIYRTDINIPSKSGKQLSRSQFWQNVDHSIPDSTIFFEAKKGTKIFKKRKQVPTHFSNLTEFLAEHDGNFLLPKHLPTGFKLHMIRRLDRNDNKILHFLYTDGLSTISMFQESHGKESQRSGKRKPKALLSFVNGEFEGLRFRLMSELSRAELLKIEKSLFVVKRQDKNPFLLSMAGIALIIMLNIIFWIWYAKRNSLHF
ncbi:MAG: hypothetical protein DWQ05_17610 [Calditrichaeota bacterium]|nr:MAG: hypothetical protein DWQ05_17610 [Calditrichota bacterium]